MSHALNYKVLAEGIETCEQYEYLYNIRCDQAQGYFFYKPMPANEIGNLLSESSKNLVRASRRSK